MQLSPEMVAMKVAVDGALGFSLQWFRQDPRFNNGSLFLSALIMSVLSSLLFYAPDWRWVGIFALINITSVLGGTKTASAASTVVPWIPQNNPGDPKP